MTANSEGEVFQGEDAVHLPLSWIVGVRHQNWVEGLRQTLASLDVARRNGENLDQRFDLFVHDDGSQHDSVVACEAFVQKENQILPRPARFSRSVRVLGMGGFRSQLMAPSQAGVYLILNAGVVVSPLFFKNWEIQLGSAQYGNTLWKFSFLDQTPKQQTSRKSIIGSRIFEVEWMRSAPPQENPEQVNYWAASWDGTVESADKLLRDDAMTVQCLDAVLRFIPRIY